MLKRSITAGLVAAGLLAAPAAFAWGDDHRPGHKPPKPPAHRTPEFDPAAAGAMAVLLASGAVSIANRRRSV